MDREIITYGGGEFLVDILRGVVMVVGDSTFGTVLRLAILVALLWMLLKLAFFASWTEALQWYLVVVLVNMMLLVPKETVVVIDRLDPGMPASVVDNVPLGLSWVAGTTSGIGDWLTRTTETAFSLPDDLRYARNGTLFASHLVQ